MAYTLLEKSDSNSGSVGGLLNSEGKSGAINFEYVKLLSISDRYRVHFWLFARIGLVFFPFNSFLFSFIQYFTVKKSFNIFTFLTHSNDSIFVFVQSIQYLSDIFLDVIMHVLFLVEKLSKAQTDIRPDQLLMMRSFRMLKS